MRQRLLLSIAFIMGLSLPELGCKDALSIGEGMSCGSVCAQRRVRPGSMKHTDSEIAEVTKEKEIKVAAISNGAYFAGDLYYTESGKRMQIGEIRLHIYAKTYRFEMDLTSHQLRTVIRDIFGNEIGTTSTKMGEDIDLKGKYAVLEQAGKRYLRLYDDSKEEVYTDLDLGNASGSILKLNLGDVLISTLNCTTCD
ncbi:MAG: hypothetical protein K2N05_06405 [Muribaculaceae bacterium]|nr:hypothetical protein [Muribaculaceae bacterium]